MSSKSKMMKNREVRVAEKFFITAEVTSTDVVTAIGTLGVNSGALLANSVSLANLGDMFRIFRVNSAKFKWLISGNTAATSALIPPQLLYILPYGAAAPSGIVSIESNQAVGDLTDYFVWSGGTTPGGIPNAAPTLKVKSSDLVVIDSASPAGWIATGADATQTHFGTLYAIKSFAGASSGAATVYWTLQIEVDISFRDLVDPTLISRRQSAASLAKPVPLTKVERSLIQSALHPVGCRCSTCKT